MVKFVLIIIFTFISVCGAVEIEPSFDQPIDPDLYMIHPGDELVVTFVNQKIDSLVLIVNPEGKIVNRTLGVFDLKNRSLQDTREILLKAIYNLYNVDKAEISITKPIPVSINVTGAVRIPGRYQAFSSDRVSDIIKKANGIYRDGSRRRILFTGGKGILDVDLDKSNFAGELKADPCLYAGLTIYVPGKSNDVVQIVGEVNSPKEIELLKSDNLELLLTLAGGLRGSADSSSLYIIRGDTRISDITSILAGDIIVVPPKEKSVHENQIALFGAVNRPGYYNFEESLELSELITNAGGYQADASIALVTVFRKPRLDLNGRVTKLRYPISGLVDEANKVVTIELRSDDSIFVPVKVGYVKVSGEVLNPGYFPFMSKQNAKYYIKNAGSFLPTANDEEILFYNPVSKITSVISQGVFIPDGGQLIIQKKEELK